MLNDFPGNDTVAATIAYVMGEGDSDDYRRPGLLDGNVERLRSVMDTSPYAQKASTWINCYEEALPSDQLRGNARASIQVALPGIRLTDVAYIIVEHHEKPPWSRQSGDIAWRSAAHIIIGPTHLPTLHRLQPCFFPADKARLEVLAELINLEQGLSSPKDPDRVRWGNQARDMTPMAKRRGLEFRQSIDVLVADAMKAGRVNDGPGLVDFLTAQRLGAVKPIRDHLGQTGLAIINPGFSQPVALLGPLYNHDYETLKRSPHAPNLSRNRAGFLPRSALFPGGYLRRDDATRELLRSELERAVARRAELNRRLYRRTNARMGAPLVERVGDGPWRRVCAGGDRDPRDPPALATVAARGSAEPGAAEFPRPAVCADTVDPLDGGAGHGAGAAAKRLPPAREPQGSLAGETPPASSAPGRPGPDRSDVSDSRMAASRGDRDRAGPPPAPRARYIAELTGQRPGPAAGRSWLGGDFSSQTDRPASSPDESADEPDSSLNLNVIDELLRSLLQSSAPGTERAFRPGALLAAVVAAVARLVALAAQSVRRFVGATHRAIASHLERRNRRAHESREQRARIAGAQRGVPVDSAGVHRAGGRIGENIARLAAGLRTGAPGPGVRPAGPEARRGQNRSLDLTTRGFERLRAAVSHRRAVESGCDGAWLVPCPPASTAPQACPGTPTPLVAPAGMLSVRPVAPTPTFGI